MDKDLENRYNKNMKVEKTSLEGVLLIKPESLRDGEGEIFKDMRGVFFETYSEAKYKNLGINVHFVEDDISISRKNVLRGMHGNDRTWKLISCLYGKVFFVALNCDEKSAAFGKWESFNLNDENRWRILVPPMYGSGYLALTDKIILQYKQSEYYKPEGQFTYRWNDPRFNISWPVKNPILSARDATFRTIGLPL
jgi:dTDP-4-dehydrorhamnose 3,5-epimerase